MELCDAIWKIVDDISYGSQCKEHEISARPKCGNCGSENMECCNGELTCTECGLVGSKEFTDAFFEPQSRCRQVGSKDKCFRFANWYTYTKDEKCAYKLGQYIEELCSRLDLSDAVVSSVKDVVAVVSSTVNAEYGAKRAKVKDSIIAVCIIRVILDYQVTRINESDVMKALNVNVRYVSKAENMLIELYNKGKLTRDYVSGQFRDPLHCVLSVCKQNGLFMDNSVIELCRWVNSKLPNEQSSQVRGAVSLYYSYTQLGYKVNTSTFCQVFRVSPTTISQLLHLVN
ncbi:hypothetical protein EB118_07260 [bacterium]|nr:hypothetical protein [bacterium]NDC94451.1 hypothetical protein [bacterium]NDD84024.1 hypothetical protein [bacterium]NDG29880.1 hypothetical protein [bacterium]